MQKSDDDGLSSAGSTPQRVGSAHPKMIVEEQANLNSNSLPLNDSECTGMGGEIDQPGEVQPDKSDILNPRYTVVYISSYPYMLLLLKAFTGDC